MCRPPTLKLITNKEHSNKKPKRVRFDLEQKNEKKTSNSNTSTISSTTKQ